MSERFGQYELHDRIAIGGMAEVFLATLVGESGFERPLAIKRILPHLAADDDFHKMFIDEAKIAVRLSHPNIAQIYDLGRFEDHIYIALEFVHGRDMRLIEDRQRKRGAAVSMPVAIHVAMKVCEALHHAHQAKMRDGRPMGLIHRDVSPQNILVGFEGEVKVIDFGLAKAAGRLAQTQAGVVKGKLAYLSPEQSRGGDIDHRSDIFALGICFFEWLTGSRLFLRNNDLDTVMAVRKGDVPTLRSIDRSIPPRLDAIVLKALEPDPVARYQTAEEFHDALETFIYEEGLILGRSRLARYVTGLFPAESAFPELPDRPVARRRVRVRPQRPTPPPIPAAARTPAARAPADQAPETPAPTSRPPAPTSRPPAPTSRPPALRPDPEGVVSRDTIPAPAPGSAEPVTRVDLDFDDEPTRVALSPRPHVTPESIERVTLPIPDGAADFGPDTTHETDLPTWVYDPDSQG